MDITLLLCVDTDRQTDTHTHTDTQTKYCNPSCAPSILIWIEGVEELWYCGVNLYSPYLWMSNQIEICAIQLKHSSSSSVMTIIGVYLPSTDHQIEEFENYLQHMLDCAIKSGHDSIWGKFSKLISHSHKASQLTDIFGSPYLKHSWQFYCLQLVVLIVVTRLGRVIARRPSRSVWTLNNVYCLSHSLVLKRFRVSLKCPENFNGHPIGPLRIFVRVAFLRPWKVHSDIAPLSMWSMWSTWPVLLCLYNPEVPQKYQHMLRLTALKPFVSSLTLPGDQWHMLIGLRQKQRKICPSRKGGVSSLWRGVSTPLSFSVTVQGESLSKVQDS